MLSNHNDGQRDHAGPSRSRARFRFGLAMVSGLALLLGACSSSSKPSASNSSATAGATGSGGSSSTTPNGTPLKIGFFGPITASNGLTTDEDYVAGLKAAINSINSSGGINGHQVTLTTCDTQATSSLEQKCARQFAGDSNLLACVACYSVADSPVVLPIVNKANLVDVGGNAPGAPVAESNAPNQIVLAPNYVNDNTFQPRQVAAVGKVYGWKTVGVSVFNFAAALSVQPSGSALNALYQKLGMKVVGYVPVPINASDYTPYIASLMKNNPDVIEVISSENGINLETEAAAQLGYKGKVFPLQEPLPKDIKSLGSKAELTIATAALPPITATTIPGIQTFLTDAQKASSAGISDLAPSNLDSFTLQSWLDVQLFADAVKTISGPITRASVLTAMQGLKDVDTGGLIAGGFTNGHPNGFEYIETVKNGVSVLAKPQPVCTAEAGCNGTPFGSLGSTNG